MRQIFWTTICAVALGAERAAACAVCFGDPESDQMKALMMAMGVLLSVVATVLTVIAVWGFRLVRNSSMSDHHETTTAALEG